MSAVHLVVGRTCNNGCRGCLWTRILEHRQPATLPLVEDVRGHRVRLAGREPTMREDLAALVAALGPAGATGIEIETNGRMLGYARYVRALRDAGVTRLVIKLFGRDEASWDAHTRVPGSFAQTMRGIETVRRVAPRIDLVALVVPRREAGAGLSDLVTFAHEHGFTRAHVELRLAKLDLAALPQLEKDVHALRSSPPAGMQVDVATV
jgi:molybdenum cofactor biosynthesis enzyme MoaA